MLEARVGRVGVDVLAGADLLQLPQPRELLRVDDGQRGGGKVHWAVDAETGKN